MSKCYFAAILLTQFERRLLSSLSVSRHSSNPLTWAGLGSLVGHPQTREPEIVCNVLLPMFPTEAMLRSDPRRSVRRIARIAFK